MKECEQFSKTYVNYANDVMSELIQEHYLPPNFPLEVSSHKSACVVDTHSCKNYFFFSSGNPSRLLRSLLVTFTNVEKKVRKFIR